MIEKIIGDRTKLFEKYLEGRLSFNEKVLIDRAVEYSLFAGGKRFRPVLAILICETLEKPLEPVLKFAAAVELIHTYSLIHDDLPAMDDDDMRRGKPSNHKVFGEGIAILAGDALLTMAFQLMMTPDRYSVEEDGRFENVLALVRNIAEAAGINGMIGGQVLDLSYEGKTITREQLVEMHMKKTGALIRVSARIPTLFFGIESEIDEIIDEYAKGLGLIFQISDDILDATSTTQKLGKPVGSDENSHKSTFVTLLGIDGAKCELEKMVKKTIQTLDGLPYNTENLVELVKYVARREY